MIGYGHSPRVLLITADGDFCEHPLLTVIIATLGQSERLRECVASVLQQGCSHLEVIVVVNLPGDVALPQLDGMPVRIVGHPVPGVCNARNAALQYAQGDMVAFLDDDVVAAPGWAHAVLAGFQDPGVYCVAGRLRPDGDGYMPAQRYASPRMMSRWILSRCQRDWVGQAISADTGFGCNMAFRRSFLERVPFPKYLGSGSEIGSADEPYMFFQVVRSGFLLLHTPDAVVTHYFRDPDERVQRRIERIHVGNIAFHLKMMADFPEERLAFFAALGKRALRAARYGPKSTQPVAMTGYTARDKLRILWEGLSLFWRVNRRSRSRAASACPERKSLAGGNGP